MRMIEYVDCPKCKKRITSRSQYLFGEAGLVLCQSCKNKAWEFVRSLGREKADKMSERELMELFLKEAD